MRTIDSLTTNQVISREIKSWMGRYDLKTIDLANLLGITHAGASKKLRGEASFSIEDLLRVASSLNITIAELLGEGILNAKIPSNAEYSNEGDKKKVAPIGFIPTGATYEVVAGRGFEPLTSGL